MNQPFKLGVIDGNGTHEEECSIIIGVQFTPEGARLIIHENGDVDEAWWRGFPDLLRNTIDRGLAERKKSYNKPKKGDRHA